MKLDDVAVIISILRELPSDFRGSVELHLDAGRAHQVKIHRILSVDEMLGRAQEADPKAHVYAVSRRKP